MQKHLLIGVGVHPTWYAFYSEYIERVSVGEGGIDHHLRLNFSPTCPPLQKETFLPLEIAISFQ